MSRRTSRWGSDGLSIARAAGEQRRMLSWPSVQSVSRSAGAGRSKRGRSKFWGGVESKIWPKEDRYRGRMGRVVGPLVGGGEVWRRIWAARLEKVVRRCDSVLGLSVRSSSALTLV